VRGGGTAFLNSIRENKAENINDSVFKKILKKIRKKRKGQRSHCSIKLVKLSFELQGEREKGELDNTGEGEKRDKDDRKPVIMQGHKGRAHLSGGI